MKTFLLATVAAVSLIASASAQTMDGSNPPPAKPQYAYECVIDKVTPPDRDDKDPSYKVNVVTDSTHIDQVWHTLRSGKTVDRVAQYEGSSGTKIENADFSTSPLVWVGKSRKNSRLTMRGIIGSLTTGKDKGKMVYIEDLYRDNEKKPVLSIYTSCHRIDV
jgi:hypothetical protein